MVTLENSVGLKNSDQRFGGVAKALHWLMALLILSMLCLGIAASKWPFDTSDTLATKGVLFSVHKTLGLFTFAVALMRIGWALSQPRPAALPVHSKIQAFAAEAVHWSLYIALVAVPLTGWIHHAASTGFAPILWPFGQKLFFVPDSVAVAAVFAKLHFIFCILLGGSITLHIIGAIKHHLIDKDATLRRMLPGQPELPSSLKKQPMNKTAMIVAVMAWAGATSIRLGCE